MPGAFLLQRGATEIAEVLIGAKSGVDKRGPVWYNGILKKVLNRLFSATNSILFKPVVTISTRLLVCVLLSLMLYGEQGYATLTICDHDVTQHQGSDQAGIRSHSKADPSRGAPSAHCHEGMICLCHLLAIPAHRPHLTLSIPSADALIASSTLFADLHPLKVFRPPIC